MELRYMLNHMIIHFVRHGETDFHKDGKYAGQIDISLNSNGIGQSRKLSKWTENRSLDLVVTSDLQRAIETAKDSALNLNCELKFDSRFREIDFGELSGLNKEGISLKYPDVYDVFYNFPTQVVFPGGESVEAAIDRTLRGLLDLINDDGLDEILLVCHATLFRLVLCVLLGLNPDQYRSHFPELSNASITTIETQKKLDFSELVGCANLIRYNEKITADS
jgi:broad specificity phosphatase PhoE